MPAVAQRIAVIALPKPITKAAAQNRLFASATAGGRSSSHGWDQCIWARGGAIGDLEVWCVGGIERNTADTIGEWHDLLSDDEVAKASRFTRQGDRNLFIVAHGLIRWRLARFLDLPPRSLEFARESYGRPFLIPSGPPLLTFNIAHTDGFVAVAFGIGTGFDLGIDVERIRNDVAYGEIWPTALAAATVSRLAKLPSAEAAGAFIEQWVLLEAYAKAVGYGLSLPLNSVEFGFDEGKPSSLAFRDATGGDGGDMRFELFRPAPRLRLALASSGRKRLKVFRSEGDAPYPARLELLAGNHLR